MLSISARGSGASAATYYETLEGDTELEDYYAQESAGYYLGNGAQAIGLVGAVNRDEFLELAAGRTPFGDVHGAGDNHRAGWDLTFCAPKSVSIVWGVADESIRDAIQGVHDWAIGESIRFIEDHAAFTRRGSGICSDQERRESVGLVIAAYRHGTSREQDPHLHTHCMTFNVAPRADSTIGALDSRPLYEWKMAAGAIYRGELAAGLRELGFELEQDEKSFRITSVPKTLEEEFSKRRQQIVASLNKHGASGARASEIAALETRCSKGEVSRYDLLKGWHERARELASEWGPTKALKPRQEQRVAPSLDTAYVQSVMTSQTSTVSEAQLYKAVAINQQLTGGRAHIEQSAAKVKADLRTIQLQGLYQIRYSTQEMQQLERQMVENAAAMSWSRDHPVAVKNLNAALHSRPSITEEQKDALRHIVQGGDLVCIQGSAGTGKSFALGAAREAWEAEGYRVRGLCLSGKAAQELEKGSGIQSITIALMEMDTRAWTDERNEKHKPRDPLTRLDILVVDEAGMIGSRQTATLLLEADQAGAKVALIGDTRQLQAIDAGAAFRSIQERIGAAHLDTIQRQHNEQDRQAVRDLRDGRAEAAIENLSSRGCVHEYNRPVDAKAAAGCAVIKDMQQGKSSIALTATRSEARDVNDHAHKAARNSGMLRSDDVNVSTRNGERMFGEGDRVLFTRNSGDLDVKNGDLGSVSSIRAGQHGQVRLTVVLDRGGERHVDTREYDYLDHGYAVTVHKVQGSTVDRAHVVAAEQGMASREWAYVAGSRHREAVHVHGDRITLAELAPAWSKARQKDVTLDYAKKERYPEHWQYSTLTIAIDE